MSSRSGMSAVDNSAQCIRDGDADPHQSVRVHAHRGCRSDSRQTHPRYFGCFSWRSVPWREHRHALAQAGSNIRRAAWQSSDGHDYLQQAAARGAAAAIVANGRGHPDLDCIEVGDTLDALGRLARRHLARTRTARALPLIAIGGAVGKTTTKELTAAVARALFGSTLSTPGNLNNLIGVPMTIFTLTAEHRAAVLECGTNTRGEIPKLAQIVQTGRRDGSECRSRT